MKMIKNKRGTFFKLEAGDMQFSGETAAERKLNEELFNTTLELNWYQDRVQELFDLMKEKRKEASCEQTLTFDEIDQIFNDGDEEEVIYEV